MRFTIAALGLAAVASASMSYDDKPDTPVGPYAPPKNITTTSIAMTTAITTEVVTAYTTYCPSPTEIAHNGVTYTVTEATTLTITNCPCTLSVPVYSTTTMPPVMSTPISPVVPPAPYPTMNTTMVPQMPTGTGAYTPPAGTSPIAPPGYTGAANKANVAVAGVLAAAGFIAAL